MIKTLDFSTVLWHNLIMAIQIDKMTVTFYGEDDCKIADKFRENVKHSHMKSINDALKIIINEWNKKQANQ